MMSFRRRRIALILLVASSIAATCLVVFRIAVPIVVGLSVGFLTVEFLVLDTVLVATCLALILSQLALYLIMEDT